MGASNDTVVNADGSSSTVKINREVITIRWIIKGEYIINAHYYSKRLWAEIINGETRRTKQRGDTTVKIELHKVNPYTVLWAGEKTFVDRGQEETFLRFRLDGDGGVLTPFTFEKKKFITPLQEGVETSIAPPPTLAPSAGF